MTVVVGRPDAIWGCFFSWPGKDGERAAARLSISQRRGKAESTGGGQTDVGYGRIVEILPLKPDTMIAAASLVVGGMRPLIVCAKPMEI